MYEVFCNSDYVFYAFDEALGPQHAEKLSFNNGLISYIFSQLSISRWSSWYEGAPEKISLDLLERYIVENKEYLFKNWCAKFDESRWKDVRKCRSHSAVLESQM